MTYHISFEAVRKKTLSFWIALSLGGLLGTAYLLATAFSIYWVDSSLFQNAGAIGVACVIVGFALKAQFDARRQSWHYVACSIAISDLMVSMRKVGQPLQGEVTGDQAAGTVQKALDQLTRYHRDGERWLFAEICLLVVFTLQWGFGGQLLMRLGGLG